MLLQVNVRPLIAGTTSALRNLPIRQRKCKFEDEIDDLEMFK